MRTDHSYDPLHLAIPRRRSRTTRLQLTRRDRPSHALKAAMTIPSVGVARPRPGCRAVEGAQVKTLTIPTPLVKDPNPRPLPWQRMAWVTWRHHRIALGGVAVFLGALAVWLWRVGLQLHHAYAAAIDCHPAGSTVPAVSWSSTSMPPGGILRKVASSCSPCPRSSGPSSGHWCWPMSSRLGTFRFAWTQGFGRWRWTLAKLVMPRGRGHRHRSTPSACWSPGTTSRTSPLGEALFRGVPCSITGCSTSAGSRLPRGR